MNVHYTHNKELNLRVTSIMNDWNRLLKRAKSLGLDIRLIPDGPTLELYFHDDYPDTILVDKWSSSDGRFKY